MKQGNWKRILAALLCAVMVLSNMSLTVAADTVEAAEGSFYLTASTSQETIIEPTAVTYTEGQTVKEALMDSDYAFEGIEAGFISSIEGVPGNFNVFMNDGGYDLQRPASEVTVAAFTENTAAYSEEMIALIIRLAEVNAMTNNAKSYEAVDSAYEAALKGIRSGAEDEAKTLLDSLNTAVAQYEALLNGEKIVVTVNAIQGETVLTAPVITLTDVYGNVTTATGNRISVIKGDYEFSVSDGGYNRTEGTISVSEATTLNVNLPSGEWFGDIQLLDADKNTYAYEQNPVNHTAVYYLEDTVGRTGVRINAAKGADIPETGTTYLYAVYQKASDGSHYDTQRSWNSTTSALTDVVAEGMEGNTAALEARLTGDDGYTMIQSYDAEIIRIPTLASLVAKDGNGTSLLSGFDANTTEYTLAAISEVLDIEMTALGDEGYSVAVSAPKMDTAAENRVLLEGTEVNKVDVTVSHTNGQSRTYTLNVTKVEPAVVTMTLPSDTTVEIQNVNGNTIAPKEGSVYELIPGETYTYIGTKNENYHTAATFTAENGLTVSVAEPKVEEALSDVAFYDKSSSSTRVSYEADSAFASDDYDYIYTVTDANSSFYAQATVANDYTATARYYQQTTTAMYHGVFKEQAIGKVVGASTGQNLQRAIAKCAYGQEICIRVSKTEDNILYYQDYLMTINRSLHMDTFSVLSGAEALTLTDAAGEMQAYDRDVTEYYLNLPADAQTINLAAAFMTEGDQYEFDGGYYAMINGSRYDNISNVTIDMDSTKETEEVEIIICHINESAVSTTYKLYVEKVEPVEITFKVTPEDAVVFVTNQLDNKTAEAVDYVYHLFPGQKYTYTVTRSGYKGIQVTDYVVPENSQTIAVELEKAAENPNLEEISSKWPSFRTDGNNNGVITEATPTTSEDTLLYWAAQLGEAAGTTTPSQPILVGDYLYSYGGSTLYKMDTLTGKTVASQPMDRATSFAINSPTYAEGMIFVGLSNGGVQAFDADTLEPLWIYNDAVKGQPNCTITYHNGYLYTGFWNGEAKDGNYVCLSVTDEDPTRGDEEKIPSWTYTQLGGFYWAGAYIGDGFMLVGTDDGENAYSTGYAHVLSINLKSGYVIDDIQLPHVGDLRSSITYDELGTKDYYFTTKGGYFYGISVNADGTFKENSLKYIKLENGTTTQSMSTSTPTVYNGRAYVGVSGTAQFSAYSGHNFTVIDLNDWEIAYQVPTQGYPQCSAILTTAYEETGKVYVYYLDNYTPGKLRVLSDQPGQTAPAETTTETYTSAGEAVNVEAGYVLFTPSGSQQQYALASPIVDEYGIMYIKNDSGYIMAVGNTIEKIEVTKLPDKTEYTVGETFDPTGMEVVLTYTNGMTRDVTRAVTYSEEPLTELDTEFQITFDYSMYHNQDGQVGVEVAPPMTFINLTFGEEQKEKVEDLFDDVNEGDWFVDAVQYVYDNGIMSGYGHNERLFGAADALSRAQIAIMLYRIEGAPEVAYRSIFQDVAEGTYFTDAVMWASQENIITGYGNSGMFGPLDTLTREQLVTMLYRYAQYKGYATDNTVDISTYPDGSAVSPYAQAAVSWAVAEGLIQGDGGYLNPQGETTRMACAAIIMRFMGKYE